MRRKLHKETCFSVYRVLKTGRKSSRMRNAPGAKPIEQWYWSFLIQQTFPAFQQAMVNNQGAVHSPLFFMYFWQKKILNQLKSGIFLWGGEAVCSVHPFLEFSGYIPENGHAILFGYTAEIELKIWCTELLIMQLRGTKHIMDIIFFYRLMFFYAK